MTKHKWHDVIVAYANGETIQFKHIVGANDTWCEYNKRRTLLPYESSPNFECSDIVWRVKPKNVNLYLWVSDDGLINSCNNLCNNYSINYNPHTGEIISIEKVSNES